MKMEKLCFQQPLERITTLPASMQPDLEMTLVLMDENESEGEEAPFFVLPSLIVILARAISAAVNTPIT